MNRCIIGDCRATMRDLIAQGVKVQMCVTSPPYWGLRDYGVEGQIGLEATPQEYVANMVEVFRLVRELLADDGTLWLNLGDTYAASRSYQVTDNKNPAVGPSRHMGHAKPPEGYKQKDLIGIPWRVAFALQADGWYLRQDIIWSKPNPMPESVRDRCTKAHEYLFLLAKNERYYYDADAIAEDAVCTKLPGRGMTDTRETYGQQNGGNSGLLALRNRLNDQGTTDTKRNRRSVWTVNTQAYDGAHFATFPPDLIEPCILAGSRPGDMVLDPFFGSGTTGEVAQRLGRQWVGIELNAAYESLQQRRTAQQGMVLV